MAKSDRRESEEEHCEPSLLEGVGTRLLFRSAGPPTAGVKDRTREYGEPEPEKGAGA